MSTTAWFIFSLSIIAGEVAAYLLGRSSALKELRRYQDAVGPLIRAAREEADKMKPYEPGDGPAVKE